MEYNDWELLLPEISAFEVFAGYTSWNALAQIILFNNQLGCFEVPSKSNLVVRK